MIEDNSNNYRRNFEAISYGEIVFDRINNILYPGGAPFNFACYLNKLGVSVSMVSSVGEDVLGLRALEFLSNEGVDTQYVVKNSRQTGIAEVTVVDGMTEFHLSENSAWLDIPAPSSISWEPNGLLYFGTVSQITEFNKRSIYDIYSSKPKHVLLDLNLRKDLYADQTVLNSINMASVLKMNKEEWHLVRDIDKTITIDTLIDQYRVELIAITYGADGAEIYSRDGKSTVPSKNIGHLVDEVGAGDAFSAALAVGVMNGVDMYETLTIAVEVASVVVQNYGAVVDLPKQLKNAFT